MKLSALKLALEEKFPKSYACEWDNDGLMCAANMDKDIRKVLCTLDVTTEALAYAVNNGYDAILSHHPMIFRPLGAITPENHIADKVIFALQNGISVFSYHTRADAAPDGVNDLLADALQLSDVRVFSDGESDCGRIGTLPAETDVYAFAGTVKKALGCTAVSVSKHKSTVKTVAVLGGAGKDFIRAAIAVGADVLLSGELGYNNMEEAAEMGITLMEAGHFFTEDLVCKYFVKIVESLGMESGYFCSNRIESI